MNYSTECFDYFEDEPIYNYPPGMLNIVNVVSTFKFGKDIDLQKILDNCEFACVKLFVAVKLCISKPRVAISIFHTGSATLIGAQNEFVSRDAAEIFTHVVKRALDDWSIGMNEFSFHNYTATCKLPFNVKLKELRKDKRHVRKSEFFPLYEIVLPNTKVRCSTSKNNIIITGVRYDGHCEEYFKRYVEYLQGFEGEDEEGAPVQEDDEIDDLFNDLVLMD